MAKPSFEAFKLSIKPYLVNVKSTAIKQLKLFKLIGDDGIKITEELITDYELFARIYQHQIKTNVATKIIPSLAVQLLWNVHSLNPREYYQDNYSAFDDLMSVQITANDEFVTHSALKKILNAAEFKKIRSKDCKFVHKLDMEHAVLRQMKFVRKMNAIQNSEDITSEKLDLAIERYIKFLYLMKLEGHRGHKRMSVPALDVDLMWHSHQFDAVNYHKMSRFMFPNETDDECIIDHDDSICFKEIMKKYRAETRARWIKTYGNDDYFQGRAFGKNLIFTKKGYLFRHTEHTNFEETVQTIKQIKSGSRKRERSEMTQSDILELSLFL